MADEELSDSPLFSLFLSSPHYAVAASSSLIVAVPPTASLSSIGRVSVSLLESHVLRKSPYYQDQLLTLNGKAVGLSHASLICKTGFSEPRTVRVLRESMYYDDDFHSFQVLHVELPLEGKIPTDYATQLLDGEGEERGIERRSLAEHEQVLVRATGDPVLPLSGPPPTPISSSSSSSSIFASMGKFVHQFNASYVLVKGFIEHAGAKVGEACARLREEALAKARLHSPQWASRRSSATELQMAVESLVMAAVYKKLFAGLCELYGREEEATQAKLQRMRLLSMEQLGVREDCHCQPSVAVALLAQLSSIPTVALQLAQLEDVSRALTAAVKEQGQALADEAQAAGEVGERRKRDTVLSAEDMIPLTLFVLLQSGLQRLQAHLQLLHHFAPSKQITGIDHLQVHLANFQAACHLVDEGTAVADAQQQREGEGEAERLGGKRPLHDGPFEAKEASPSSLASASLSALSTTGARYYQQHPHHPHARALSTSSSLGSLSSSHPRHRSPSSSPQPPLHRPSSVRSSDDAQRRPALGRPPSSTLPEHMHADATSDGRSARSRTQRINGRRAAATLPAALGSHTPPHTSSTSSLSCSSKPSTNPFDSPARDGGGSGHFPFPFPPPLSSSSSPSLPPPPPSKATPRAALSSSAPQPFPAPLSSSTARSGPSSTVLLPRSLRAVAGERGSSDGEEEVGGVDDDPAGLGDFLAHLKRSDEVVTGSLRAIQQR